MEVRQYRMSIFYYLVHLCTRPHDPSFRSPLPESSHASFDVVAAKDVPRLIEEAESFLGGKPERFAQAGFEKSCDESERLVNSPAIATNTGGFQKK